MALEGHLRIIISPAIIREIGLVFRHPRLKKTMERHHLSSQEVEEAIFKILKVATITPGEALTQGVSRDPADDQVLWCAVEGRADFIISGDQDLTVLESYEGIRILAGRFFEVSRPDMNIFKNRLGDGCPFCCLGALASWREESTP